MMILVYNDIASLNTYVNMCLKALEERGLSNDISEAIRKYLDCADVILTTCLHCKASGKVVTIGNTHLWWDDDLHPDVKCVQVITQAQAVVI